MRRKLLAAVGAVVLLAALGTPASAGSSTDLAGGDVWNLPLPETWPAPPAATAAAYLVLDAGTGQALAARSADNPRPVASTVKMLTALTVLGRARLDDVVDVGAEVVGAGGASVGLRPGDRWTVEQLLDGLLARSGNDAALALATHIGGSLDGFLELMRADAAALGLDGVVITSPSGLDDGNLLSARDLAVIARAAMADPRLRMLVARSTVDLPRIGTVAARNEFLERYPGASGIKTGYTMRAGWSLVASAERAGREVIAVVLASRDDAARYEDAAQLIDHALAGFVPLGLPTNVRVRGAGNWISLAGGALPGLVWTPVAGARGEVELVLPLALTASRIQAEIVAGSGGATVWRWPLRGTSTDRSATGSRAVGAWGWDQAYAAMRAVANARQWP